MALTNKKKLCRPTTTYELSRPTSVKTFVARSSKPALVRNKYLIVTSDAFLLQNNVQKNSKNKTSKQYYSCKQGNFCHVGPGQLHQDVMYSLYQVTVTESVSV